MPRSHNDGGEATNALRGEEGRRAACETGLRKKDKKRKRKSDKAPQPHPPAPSQENRATSSADDGLDWASVAVAQRVREIVAMNAKSLPADEIRKNIFVYQRSVFPLYSSSMISLCS
jgi:hypothetical protein